MKTYPSVSARPVYKANSVYVFDKLDGSNIRAEWTRKRGFHKFGRRNGLLDHSIPALLEAPDLIMRDWASDLSSIFKAMRGVQKVTAFFEFWGDSSFAGAHVDEEHRCTLIDVGVHPKGILEPKEFIRLFKGLDHAALLHQGPFSRELAEQVRSGTLEGMTFEGVIVKGGYQSPGRPLMFKVKNQAWLDRLRVQCGADEALFEKMK